MRNKVTILAAAIAMAVSGAFAADQVYSVNAVGFVKVTVPTGFSLVANPLLSGNDTLGAIIPTAPDLTKFYYYDKNSQSYSVIATYFAEDGVWTNPEVSFKPGEGAFIKTSTPFDVTFVGTVPQSTEGTPLRIDLAAGFTIASSHVPQSLPLTADSANPGAPHLNFPVADLDKIYFYRNGNYQILTYFAEDLAWSGPTPTPAVGEAFFVKKAAPATWERSFTVNN